MTAEVGHSGVVRAPTTAWRYDMAACPRGRKLLLLTDGGIAVIGQLADNPRGYMAWAPLPDRDKAKEKDMGL
jgi:hypothetical protein